MKEYMNMVTGELTQSHAEAMGWFRAGDNVAVLVNGVQRCTWEW